MELKPKLLKMKTYLLWLDSHPLNYERFQSKFKTGLAEFPAILKTIDWNPGKITHMQFDSHPTPLLLFLSSTGLPDNQRSVGYGLGLPTECLKEFLCLTTRPDVALTRSPQTAVVSVYAAGWTWQPEEKQCQDHLSRAPSLLHMHEYCKCKSRSNRNKK